MFRPRIIGFICNWSLPTETVVASPKAIEGYPKIHIVRVMCAGRVDPAVVLETFAQGADGVLIVGCPSPDCHYAEGNFQAERKVEVLKKLLALTGLEPARLRLDWVHAVQVESFAKVVDDFRGQIMTLGQSPLAGERPDEKILVNVLAAYSAVADFRLRVLTGRERELTEALNVYGETIPKGEFAEVLDEIVEDEFIRNKIHLLTKRRPRSIKELAVNTDLTPALILRHIVGMRRRGTIALDHIEDTTPFYKALEVQ